MVNKSLCLLVIGLFITVFSSFEIIAKPKVKVKTVRIKVNEDGYAPSSIAVKKGVAVRLAFYRADANNCGEEVVFPKLNIKRSLPVGKTVIVQITPKETGDLNFTCGMGMYQGKLLVTN